MVCVCLLSLERQLESEKCRACWLASEGQQGKCLDVFCAHLQLRQCSRRVPCLCTYTGFVLGVGDSHSHLPQLGSGGVLQHPCPLAPVRTATTHPHPPQPGSRRVLHLSLQAISERNNDICQYLHPVGASHLSPAPPADDSRLTNKYPFQIF